MTITITAFERSPDGGKGPARTSGYDEAFRNSENIFRNTKILLALGPNQS